MMTIKGQITFFVIIGLLIVIIVASLIFFLPTIITTPISTPKDINLQMCVDNSFAEALYEISTRGGTCAISGTYTTLNSDGESFYPYSEQVCVGVIRTPAGRNGINLIKTNTINYGSRIFTNLPNFRNEISNAALEKIRDCAGTDNVRGNPTVVLGDSVSELRIQARSASNENFITVSSTLNIPFRQMHKIIQDELYKSVRPELLQGSDSIYGLTHRFLALVLPPETNLEANYVGDVSNEGHNIFFVSTTNNPLPLSERNLHLAVIIQNRYPVIEDPNVPCTDIKLIDPDELERDIHTPDWIVPCDDISGSAEGLLSVNAGSSSKNIQLDGGSP